MLAKLLKGNQNFIPILIFILWGVGFFFLNMVGTSQFNTYVSGGLAALGMLIIGIVYNGLSFFKSNHYFIFLWAFAYLMFSCCVEYLSFFSALFFVLIVLSQLVMAEDNDGQTLFNAFDLGFYMGIAICLHPPFWIFGVLFMIIVGIAQLRNIFLYLIGLLALALLGLEIIAILDIWELWYDFKNQLYLTPYTFDLSDLYLVPLFALVVIAAIDYFQNLNRQQAHKKAIFFDGVLWFVCAIVYAILYGLQGGNTLILISIPLVLFMANFLTHSKVLWYKEGMLWVFIVSLLLYRFHDLIIIPTIFESITF